MLNVEKHLEQDIAVTTQDQRLWLDIGLVKNGKTSIEKFGFVEFSFYNYTIIKILNNKL